MKNKIELIYHGEQFSVPNNWDDLTQEQYLHLVRDMMLMSEGKLSPGEVRIRLLCDIMHWEVGKIRNEDAIANLVALSERLTFLFTISYPDNNAALDGLSREEKALRRRVDPYQLPKPLAEKLSKLDYRYTVDLSFFKQQLPSVVIGGKVYHGYRADKSFNQLTLSLTALQYLEARELINNARALPLMAAILYCPGEYDTETAHTLGSEFVKLPNATLQAISWNFQAVNNFLFTMTSFSLLTKFKEKKPSLITTDASDALYDLSADGLGNNREVERMNVLTYLRILRKKTIDTVRQMRGMKMDTPTISIETGLPLAIINDII